jgi:predicted SAM-dependent methyltransferase
MVRVNVGCGRAPTRGWKNFDNSPSLRLSKLPLLAGALRRAGLIDSRQYEFIQFARSNSVEYGNAVRRLPLPSDSVDVIYSSHMLEHLDRTEAMLFLRESKRVLRRGGTLRLAVPDLRHHVRNYIASNDAEAFITATELTRPQPKTWAAKFKILFSGYRHHLWMYDGDSLTRLLAAGLFVDIRVLKAGTTTIDAPEPLDLYERADESVYVEARKS